MVLEVRDARIAVSTSHPQVGRRRGGASWRARGLGGGQLSKTGMWAPALTRPCSPPLRIRSLGHDSSSRPRPPRPCLQVPSWCGPKPRLLLLNRADEVSAADLAAWREHYAAAGQRVFWTDGRNGEGVQRVKKELLKVGGGGG
mgnify:CR=1 FL=1